MTEGQEKDFNKLISKEEIEMLRETVNTQGWGVLKKINQKMAEDWVAQTAFSDFSDKTDEELGRKLRFRHGMIKGMASLISYVEKKLSTKVVHKDSK